LGPVRGTLVGRKDGTVAQQFKKGFEWSKTEQRYDLYSAFLKGLELAGDDAPFAATRVWKQDESTKSGYQQRKDSTINRFEYKALSYAETNNMAMNFGRGLVSLGIQPKTPVSIFAANSPEWLVYLFGLYTQSMPCIPLYPSLGPDSLEYILNLAQTECLVVSVENIPAFNKLIEKEPHIAELVKNLIILDCIADAKFGNVKHVVQGDLRNDLKSKYDINVYGMSEIIEFGAKNQQIPLVESQGDDVAFIMFTSGTTGNPKGVVLTHTNITSCAGCVGDIVQLDPAIRMFIFLPLQHIFSVVLCGICILVGGTIYFSQGDVKQIASDMLECKPQILPSVPRIFQKFFQIIWATVDQMPFYKRWYITNAYNYQLYQARNGLPLDPTYDQKVFSQFREKLGMFPQNNLLSKTTTT
jgi:long-chain acyl-CoA synthetase